MKQVTAYASSQQLEKLMTEFMNMGIEEIKTFRDYSTAAGISRIKLLCQDFQVDKVRTVINTFASTSYVCGYYVSVRETDRNSFLKSVT